MAKRTARSRGSYLGAFSERQAARMRLPTWLRYLMPLLICTAIFSLTALAVVVLWQLHRLLHPGVPLAAFHGPAAPLVFFSSFLGVMAPALMVLNVTLHAIPPMRRIFEKEYGGGPDVAYDKSMKDLRKMALLVGLPCLVLALVGAVEPWAF